MDAARTSSPNHTVASATNGTRRPLLDAAMLANPRWGNIALGVAILFSLVMTALIWALGDRLQAFPKLPDEGPMWYYWKLAEPSAMTRIVAWASYGVHQLFSFGLIYYAQTRVRKYVAGLHPVNVVALLGTAAFSLWHVAQSHLFYDGLAQDTPIWSSQLSVIILLVWVLLMENPRRGLFFGKKVPFRRSLIDFARKYHGYLFSWATIFTFWFHPTENTLGHLWGFLYMFLMLMQGGLFFTRLHINRWWMFAQEALVLVHGALVAVQQGSGLWPMFAFGFAGIVVVTQMHGLGLPRWVRLSILTIYVAAAAATYSTLGWARLNEVIRIPLIEYASVFVLAGLIGLPLWVVGRLRGRQTPAATMGG